MSECQHEACEIDAAGNPTRCADCEAYLTDSEARTVKAASRPEPNATIGEVALAWFREQRHHDSGTARQHEPSDAQVHTALSTYLDVNREWAEWETWQIEAMRSALRAAGSVVS